MREASGMTVNRKKTLREGLLFSAITLCLSYLVFWGPIAVFKVPAISFVSNVRGPIWAIVLFLLGGFVPSVVGIVLTRIREGTDGLKSLLKRCLQFRLGLNWYLAIVIVVLLGSAGQLIIHSLLGNSFNLSLYRAQLPSFIPLIVFGPISEELGWRGYLLCKIQSKWNALLSSSVVGLVWAFWHLPLFFVIGTSQHELHLPFVGFLVGTVAVSIIFTWINNNTNNSIWAAILLHWLYTYAAQVNSTGVTRSLAYNWLEFSPYVLIAIVVLAIWKPKQLALKKNDS
jgi:membrane protease YdiL (CAAX protease family)